MAVAAVPFEAPRAVALPGGAQYIARGFAVQPGTSAVSPGAPEASVLSAARSAVPARRHAPSLLIGGGVVMAIVGGIIAALLAIRNTKSAKDGRSPLGEPSDAGGMVVTPPDGSLAVAPPDAGQYETTRDALPQSSRGVDDANTREADRAPIGDRGN